MAEKYFAMIDGEQRGPFTLEELPKAGVRPSTYIWTKGLPDWQKAEDNPEVCRLFRNHLYDLMHPSPASTETPSQNPSDPNNPWKVQPDAPAGKTLTRYDYYLQQSGNDPLPTLEEIEANKDKSIPPISFVGYAWLVTIFCFFPTGIVALVNAYKSKNAWKRGENEMAHEFNRKAKMWTGITLFIGLFCYGIFLALAM